MWTVLRWKTKSSNCLHECCKRPSFLTITKPKHQKPNTSDGSKCFTPACYSIGKEKSALTLEKTVHCFFSKSMVKVILYQEKCKSKPDSHSDSQHKNKRNLPLFFQIDNTSRLIIKSKTYRRMNRKSNLQRLIIFYLYRTDNLISSGALRPKSVY